MRERGDGGYPYFFFLKEEKVSKRRTFVRKPAACSRVLLTGVPAVLIVHEGGRNFVPPPRFLWSEFGRTAHAVLEGPAEKTWLLI